jgi:ribonuclease G
MDREEDSQQVLALLSEKIKQDRTKSHVVGMTGLGLVEMTRKKARQGLDAVLQQSCPYCSGRGKVLAADVISARTERQLRSFLAGLDAEAILVELHQSVAGLLIGPNGSYLRKLEEDTGKIIYIRGSDTIHVEKYKILAVGSQAEVRVQAFPVAVGEIHQVKVEEPHTNNPYDGIARLNGFIIDVQAGGAYVGEEISVEILEVTKTFARAKVG